MTVPKEAVAFGAAARWREERAELNEPLFLGVELGCGGFDATAAGFLQDEGALDQFVEDSRGQLGELGAVGVVGRVDAKSSAVVLEKGLDEAARNGLNVDGRRHVGREVRTGFHLRAQPAHAHRELHPDSN